MPSSETHKESSRRDRSGTRRSNDEDDDNEEDRHSRRKHDRKGRRRGEDQKNRRGDVDSRSEEDSYSENDDGEDEDDGRKKRRRHRDQRKKDTQKSKKARKSRSRSRRPSKKHKKRSSSSSSSSSSSDEDSSSSDSSASSSSSNSSDGRRNTKKKSNNKKTKTAINERLLVKLQARGETLEERKERRGQKRAAKIQARFGYTAEENPFNDPNLHETFTWTKKKEKSASSTTTNAPGTLLDPLQEIDMIRKRRKDREAERDEMDRLRAEESRMKELENYDDWARKEEEFHLEQQRKRSAIRLVEGREKPIDVLAKNLLLFGLSDEEKNHRAAVKYKERYNALDQLDQLEAELQEPHKIVAVLKLVELKELLEDINIFRTLEREGMSEGTSRNTILLYWDSLQVVARDEIKLLQNGGDDSPYAKKVANIREIFKGQSKVALIKMSAEIDGKLTKPDDAVMDKSYWSQVKEQIGVHLSKLDLSELHSKMLIRQLERLEQRKEDLGKQKSQGRDERVDKETDARQAMVPLNVSADFGNAEEELGETDEVVVDVGKSYAWQDRYAPRKPRYFNRVKTGYDWNKYNQTHYDHENPPPKTVQGYKFNIFYPDLVDPTKTPQFFIEPADSNDFCILRFHAGPPYEDIAFKIINREWNRSRKRGFKSTFERGVLSLYFNFTTHWYRR